MLLLTGALAGGATPALADGIALGAGVGTLGFEGHLATEVNSFLALRLNANYAKFTVPDIGVYDTDFGGISYDVTGDYLTVGALADFHPLGLSPVGSGFVLTGGIYYNKNEFTAATGPINANTVGNNGSTGTAELVGNITFQNYAPYVGLGYDGTFHGILPVSFFARAGVLFQGSPSVRLTDRQGNVNQSDLDAEARQVEDDMSNYKYYPVFSVGMTISF